MQRLIKSSVIFGMLSMLGVVYMPKVESNAYVEVSTGMIFVNAPAETARPTLADVRLGYTHTQHHFELALMTSISDGDVNQLSIDVPSVVSALYHYVPETNSSLKLHYIVGASRVEVDSSYPGIVPGSDSFSGVSFGIGFEEHFQSRPNLKVSVDLLQLYLGEDLDIYSLSLGLHYDF